MLFLNGLSYNNEIALKRKIFQSGFYYSQDFFQLSYPVYFLMRVNRCPRTFALGVAYAGLPWPYFARGRLFRDDCFSYTRELRLLMNIFCVNRNAVDTGRTSKMHLNWPWIGVMAVLNHSTLAVWPIWCAKALSHMQ